MIGRLQAARGVCDWWFFLIWRTPSTAALYVQRAFDDRRVGVEFQRDATHDRRVWDLGGLVFCPGDLPAYGIAWLQGSGFRVEDLGFRIEGVGLRVEG